MRRIRLVLLLLGMLLAVGILQAQKEEIIVSYYTTYVRDDMPSIGEAFMEEVQARLLEFSVNITLVHHFDGRDIPNNSLLDFSFYEVFDGERIIVDTGLSIWTDYGILEEISPILETELGISTQLSNEDSEEFAVALILYATGKNQEALELLADTEPLAPLDPMIDGFADTGLQHLLGNIHLALGNYETAIEYLQMDENAWYIYGQLASLINLAWVYVVNEESETGIELLNSYEDFAWEAGMGGEMLSFIWVKRAQLAALAFDYDKAIIDADRAISYWESYCTDNTLLTEVYTQEMYCKTINTRLAELYTVRGQIIFLIYEWDRVLADFNHAIELDSNYAPAYFQRGVLYYTMTQRENALADFEHYLELEPDGLYAEEAAQYIESIEIELDALGG